jgi:hypothetical protein
MTSQSNSPLIRPATSPLFSARPRLYGFPIPGDYKPYPADADSESVQHIFEAYEHLAKLCREVLPRIQVRPMLGEIEGDSQIPVLVFQRGFKRIKLCDEQVEKVQEVLHKEGIYQEPNEFPSFNV